jgi:DNA-binding transcriptional LysR family regulator
MVDFRMLMTFTWVANLRSFRGAAEKLNTTQPAISLRIAQLEDLLGVRLLERNRRLVVPTEKGQELLGFAERLLRLRAEMIEAVGDRSTMRGIVRLGVAETIVHTWLPTLIEQVNVAPPGQLRQLKTKTALPPLNFVVSWPSTPDSFNAQKVAEIATRVAKASGRSRYRARGDSHLISSF